MHSAVRTQASSGAQQGSPTLPHPDGVVHVPDRHSSAPDDPHPSGPSQQGSPSLPQDVHEPPSQARPARHTSPVQHASPEAPQASLGVVHTPVRHASPGAHSLEPMQLEPSGATHLPVLQV